MAKYEPLGDLLASLESDRVTLRFNECASLVDGLPPSARADRTWWGNTTNRRRVQAQAWMGAGWLVEQVNLIAEEVVFVRDSGALK